MTGTLKFRESVSFSFLDNNLSKVRDDYSPQMMGQASRTTGLNVQIAATHSGIVTRNNGFYLPEKMRNGAASFTKDYNKPILLHHDEHKDPIGRIVAADYVDTSGLVRDKYRGTEVRNKKGKLLGTINDALINDFVSDKMPFVQQVDVVRNLLKDALDDSEYGGLGYIKLTANISDPDSIQKLLDGRYITGSVGATTNRVVCSICKCDWTKSGSCEHKPGGVYDEAKCFLITGDLIYDEYSFVNVPADRHSRVLQLDYNGHSVDIEMADDYKGRIYEAQLEFPQYDSSSKEENRMEAKIKDEAIAPVAETVPETVVAKPAEEPVVTTETVVAKPVEETVVVPVVESPVQDKTEKLLLDEIVKLGAQLGELRSKLEVVQKEYNLLSKDLETVQDSLVKEKLETRKVRESYLGTLVALRDQKVEKNDFTKFNDGDLEMETKKLSEVVDMIKITGKLGDGMSRVPVGDIVNPTGPQDSTTVKNKISMADLVKIQENYYRLRFSQGQIAAENYLADMRLRGLLPQDLNDIQGGKI